MYKYYETHLIKILSPMKNEILSLDLNGDEEELKELLSTLISIPVNSIKGLRDSYGNYYTISSAIKNQTLTSSYGNIFTVVLGRQSIVQDFNRKRFNTILELNESKSDTTAHFGNNMNDQNRSYEVTNPNNNAFISLKNISSIRNINPIPTGSFNGSIANSLDRYFKVIMKMVNEKIINEKSFQILKKRLKEDNEEVLSLFRKYAIDERNLDYKTLSAKLVSLLELPNDGNINYKGNNNNYDSNDQNSNYKSTIDSLSEALNQNDIRILHKLLLCDNQLILKALGSYECSNDKGRLIIALNDILEKYKRRLSVSTYEKNDNNTNDNAINGYTSIMDIKVAEALSPVKNNDREKLNSDMSSKIKDIESKLRFDLSALFAYDYNSKSLFEKERGLTETGNININNLNNVSINEIAKYYLIYLKEKVLNKYSSKEKEIYEGLIKNKDERIVGLYDKFKMNKNKDIETLVNKIQLLIGKVEDERREDESSDSKGSEKAEAEEEQEEDKETSLKESESDDDDNILKPILNNAQYIINNQKLQNIVKITYNDNSHNTNINTNNTVKQNSKTSSTSSHKARINQKEINKQLNDFIKVINKMVVSEDSKKDILQLLSQKNERMVKVFENFQNNRLSLTKNILLNVISKTSSTSNKLKPKTKTKKAAKKFSSSSHKKLKKESFEECIKTFLDKKLISPEDFNYLLNNFESRDEYLYSFWELYLEDPNKEEFFESIKMFLQKGSNTLGNRVIESDINTQRQILTNLNHEFVNYKRIEGAELKRKQKRIADLLFKGDFINQGLLNYINNGIEKEDKVIIAAFDVFNSNLNYEDFIETLSILKANKSKENNTTLSMENKLETLLKSSSFNTAERKVLQNEFCKDNQMLCSILEAYHYEEDADDAIENLKIIADKLNSKK